MQDSKPKKERFPKALLGLAVIAGVIGVVAVSQAATDGKLGFKPGPEEKEAIHEAMESGDYATWLALVPDEAPIKDQITEENFDRFTELHNLKKEGKFEEAKTIADELGLPGKMGMGKGMKGHFDPERREAVDQALESGDYEAWAAAMQPKVVDVVNADNFDRFIEMVNLKKEGKFEEAKTIADELGLPDKAGHGPKQFGAQR